MNVGNCSLINWGNCPAILVDILDLAWDQVVEVAGDVWGTVKDWTCRSLGWARDKVVGAYSWVMGSLGSLKDKLSKKE